MKFFILAITIATSLIPTIIGSPVATDVATKRLETSKAAEKDTFKPSWHTIFKSEQPPTTIF
jgi:hypothetical protein